jgi:hypothetical protein
MGELRYAAVPGATGRNSSPYFAAAATYRATRADLFWGERGCDLSQAQASPRKDRSIPKDVNVTIVRAGDYRR